MAKVCAVFSYSLGLRRRRPRRGPGRPATSAWRAEACRFSTSVICRVSFISSWRWLPITAAACWTSAWCCRCASSIACWICTFGSAYSSIFAPNSAIRYFQPLTNGFAMLSCPLCGIPVTRSPAIAPSLHPGSPVPPPSRGRRLKVLRSGAQGQPTPGSASALRETSLASARPARMPSSSPASSATRRAVSEPPSVVACSASSSDIRATRPSSPSTAACIRASSAVAAVAQPGGDVQLVGDRWRERSCSSRIGPAGVRAERRVERLGLRSQPRRCRPGRPPAR